MNHSRKYEYRFFILRWLISISSALMISIVSSHVNASSAKTISFVLDNDILVPGSRDQDYTGGLNISYTSEDINLSPLYFDKSLEFFDGLFAVERSKINLFNLEVGLYGFTPEDTQMEDVNFDDRPYSSLLYFSNTHERIDIVKKTAWQSRLTFGFLGLDIFPNLQEGVHNLTGSKQPLGWEDQISDGGEPTIRYQLVKQKAIDLGISNIEMKYSQQLSLGYISETSFSLSSRFGRFNSSWWNFNPEVSSYGEQRNSLSGDSGESYAFVGASIKYRFYNAFLQGQFRESHLSYKNNQLNHLLFEAWAGYTQSFENGYQISYILRAHTSEVKSGVGDRSLIWGGLSLSKSWY
jgi:hypothetical protein